jgi:hypothetical protein
MKLTLSTRVLVIICVVAIFLSAFNTYLILDRTRTIQDQLSQLKRDYAAEDSIYGYVIFQDGGLCKAKNQTSGSVDFAAVTASLVISQAIDKGNSVYIKFGNYTLSTDVQVINKKNARIVSDGATIIGNGKKLIIKGDNYSVSQYNLISGLTIINGTVRIENSFGTIVSNIIFENCSTALEIANTETWSEGTKIDNSHFVNSTESIAFRTPTGNATGSYANTEISRCFFNLLDDSVGIKVEQRAEYSDSQLENVRIWMGEYGKSNQTGLSVDGSMFQTLLSSVVFESFANLPLDNASLYGIKLGETADPAPILGSGVNFLGNWTARIYNPFSKWISGFGGVFSRENVNIVVGVNNQYGTTEIIYARPLAISSFKLRVQVQGSFGNGETVTVRFRLEFVDNVVSRSVEKSFTNSSTSWLDDDDMLQLFPAQNVIWAILVDAKSSSASTDAVVQIDVYGVAT